MAARPKLPVLHLRGVIGQGYQNPIYHGSISNKIMTRTTSFLAVQY
jgi:hypothetical protein